MDLVGEVRAFNRFYTRRIGLLARHLPGADLSLPMARVLYEIATAEIAPTAADLTRALDMDKAHLSRVIAKLRGRGLIEGRPATGKRIALAATVAGRETFAALDRGSAQAIDALLGGVAAADRPGLAKALATICATLGGEGGETTLRPLAPGDVGWIAHRQGLLYHREYGWDLTFEALVARILADFVDGFDPEREAAFIAARGGAVVGSVFLMKSDDPRAAKTPAALCRALRTRGRARRSARRRADRPRTGA